MEGKDVKGGNGLMKKVKLSKEQVYKRLWEDSIKKDVSFDKEDFLDFALFLLPYRRMKEVVIVLYGLNDGFPKSFYEVAKVFGVTSERIKQLNLSAMRRIRRVFEGGPNNNWKKLITLAPVVDDKKCDEFGYEYSNEYGNLVSEEFVKEAIKQGLISKEQLFRARKKMIQEFVYKAFEEFKERKKKK